MSLQTPIQITRHWHKSVNKTEGSNARKIALCDKNSVVYFVALSRACALTRRKYRPITENTSPTSPSLNALLAVFFTNRVKLRRSNQYSSCKWCKCQSWGVHVVRGPKPRLVTFAVHVLWHEFRSYTWTHIHTRACIRASMCNGEQSS